MFFLKGFIIVFVRKLNLIRLLVFVIYLLNSYSSCPQVGYNKADIGLYKYQCRPGWSFFVKCSHHEAYGHYHWISRAPLQVLPIWNVLGIFDYHSWVFLIFFMFVVYGILLVMAKVGACYGIAFHYQEIPLFPVR